MKVPKRLLALAVIAFLVAVPLVVVAQQQRYIDQSYPYAVCENCHYQEGYLPIELVPVVPPEVRAGQEFNLSLVIVNPWEHQIRQIDAALNLSLADDKLEFLEGGSTDEFEFQSTEEGLRNGEFRRRTMQVRPGLTSFVLDFSGEPGFLDQNSWTVTITHETGEEIDSCSAGPGQTPTEHDGGCKVELPNEDATIPANPAGDWTIRVRLDNPLAPPGETYAWNISARAEYSVDLESHKTPATDPTIKDVGPFGQQAITWRVRATQDTGDYTALFKVRVELYHDHETFSDSDSAFVDDRTEYAASVGDEYVQPEGVAGVTVKRDTTAFMRSWGKVTGFASLLMILPSFLFVGLFSRHNKYAMNRFFGSARNRVVWHAAVSWIIILLAVVHMTLFLLEPRFDEFDFLGFKYITGWVALAFMFGLGITGVWQIPFTKRMGYKWWRWLHMYMGIAAFGFSVFHTLYDGEEFAWLTGEKATTVPSMVLGWLSQIGLF